MAVLFYLDTQHCQGLQKYLRNHSRVLKIAKLVNIYPDKSFSRKNDINSGFRGGIEFQTVQIARCKTTLYEHKTVCICNQI